MGGRLIPVVQLDKEGNYVQTWRSIKEAQDALHITHISSVCRGKRKTDGGYIWMYSYDYFEAHRPKMKKYTKN